LPIDFSKIRLPRLSDEEIRSRADEFRQKHWGTKLPIDVELIIERSLDLIIIPVPGKACSGNIQNNYTTYSKQDAYTYEK
jgi:hypothetical protein